MTTRAAVVAEARTWIGTRFHHQAALKGVGCDCVGLVMGVGIALELLPADFTSLPEFAPYRGYSRVPRGDGFLEKACARFGVEIRIQEAGIGDVLTFSFGGDPSHMAILGDYPDGGFSLIHAYAPQRRVLEARFDDAWRGRAVTACRYPGVDS